MLQYVCTIRGIAKVYYGLVQLAFPAYVICLVIIIILASEYSSKFAKIIGKGNPVAVLATMILFPCTQFLNVSFCCIRNLLLAHEMLMLQ